MGQGISEKIDPILLEAFAEAPEQEVLLVLEEKADVSKAKQLITKEEKGLYVYRSLLKTAGESQKEVIAFLEKKNILYRSYFIVNAIYARMGQEEAKVLASFPEIKSLLANPSTSFPEPVRVSDEASLERDGAEWGIKMIGADEVWAMGYRGQGVVVGGQDTGYDWAHPALQSKYRGWDNGSVDHNYNWHDAIHEISPIHGDSIPSPDLNPCGLDLLEPCDDHSHGTHTMGTMIGSEGENDIGVAPEARWIGVRNMERGYGSPVTYLEGYQWFLAPTDLNGENADPAKAPHVINNSWSCPEMEGCELSNFHLLEEAVNNLKTAGVVVVVSAGNSGPGCSSINTPSAIFENSFSVGATRYNDSIANFSSRGPVLVDGSHRMKPNISAPGVGVRSSTLNNEYATFSGTSMAGPHVAGVVALMISANPELAGQVETIETIIEQTAVPKTDDQECGGLSGMEVPNPIYGHGRIDALAAVQEALLHTNTEEPAAGALRVFPNPASHSVQISFPNADSPVDLLIYDAAGRLVKSMAAVHPSQSIDIQDLATGLHFIQVRTEEQLLLAKVVVHR